MGKPRITITLDQKERSALMKLASHELREPRDQARYILRQELIRLGLLPQNTANPSSGNAEGIRSL
jgi:hypothetical protein